MPDGKQK